MTDRATPHNSGPPPHRRDRSSAEPGPSGPGPTELGPGAPPRTETTPSTWSSGFYATEPHQPTYRPPRFPSIEADRGSLLDLRAASPRAGGDAGRDNGDPGRSHAVAGLAGLGVVATATILAASFLPDAHHGASAHRSTSAAARQAASPARAPASGLTAASSIDTAITRSVAARRLIGPANTRTGACRATSADVTTLNTAATTRTELVTGLGGLDVRALAGGAAVVTDLRRAWTYSARADKAYAAWAGHHLSCSGHAATHGNADWESAHHNDALSSAAKARAVKNWNPLARRYHLAARTAGTI